MEKLREFLLLKPPPQPAPIPQPTVGVTLLGSAMVPDEVDGWRVSVGPTYVELERKSDGRYLKTYGEPWMAADTLVYRALEAAAGNDIDLERNPTRKAVAQERWRIYRRMAEALVARDRQAALSEGPSDG